MNEAGDAADAKMLYSRVRLLRPRQRRALPMLNKQNGEPAKTSGEVQQAFCYHFAGLHSAAAQQFSDHLAAVREDDLSHAAAADKFDHHIAYHLLTAASKFRGTRLGLSQA